MDRLVTRPPRTKKIVFWGLVGFEWAKNRFFAYRAALVRAGRASNAFLRRQVENYPLSLMDCATIDHCPLRPFLHWSL